MRIRFPVVVVGSLLFATAAMADSVPTYDMARTCRLDHAAASGLAVTESMKNCVRDEKRAFGQLQKQWAKFFTVIITASFIPLELWELVRRFSGVKTGVIVVNLVIVFYLIAKIKNEKGTAESGLAGHGRLPS